LLNILNTIDETRESFVRQGVTPHFVLAFRGPATLLTQTDLSRLKPEDRETASKIAAKLKQLHATPASSGSISAASPCVARRSTRRR
jgi:hypothetical protein